ncbi:MAG: AMP-binding protein [Acidimicrobiales bacterium]
MIQSASSLAGVIERAAFNHPDGVAIVDDSGSVTFAQLQARVRTTAILLDQILGASERVAVIGPNHRIWIELYYGVPASNRTLVFLNHRLHARELLSMIERSAVSIVLGDADELNRLRAAGCELPHFDWDTWADLIDGITSPVSSKSSDIAKGKAASRAPAWLLFTSGTTAAPKGAMLTSENILASVNTSAAARPVEQDEIYVFPFPLCHIAGYNVVHRHAHSLPVVLLSSFTADGFCDIVQRERVTSTSLAATMLASLIDLLEREPYRKVQLQSLRAIAYGAAPMPVSLLRKANELLDVEFAQGYGMTELAGNAVFLNAQAHRNGLESNPHILEAAGVAAPGVEVRLVSEEGNAVTEGDAGEIIIRGPQVMIGYLNDPAATDAAVRDGWLYTGDIGRMVDGLLYVVDRKKDIIITGGENVSSLEVESAVLEHPGIARAAVIGVPDPVWGENVCAVVVLRAGALVETKELVTFVRQSLSGFKVPRHVVIVEELPVTASGKVVKAELRRFLLQRPELLGERL